MEFRATSSRMCNYACSEEDVIYCYVLFFISDFIVIF